MAFSLFGQGLAHSGVVRFLCCQQRESRRFALRHLLVIGKPEPFLHSLGPRATPLVLREDFPLLESVRKLEEESENSYGRRAASRSVVVSCRADLTDSTTTVTGWAARVSLIAPASPALSSSFAAAFPGRCSPRNSGADLGRRAGGACAIGNWQVCGI
jgi:hypothetical protein